MADPIRLVVHGLPAPQGSKTRMPNGAMVDGTSKTGRANLAAWRDAVRAECRRWLDEHPMNPLAEPVNVMMAFEFPPVPSSPYRYRHQSAPDLSKLIRSTEDAMVQGGLLKDDRFITSLQALKIYAPEGRAVGCTIEVVSHTENEAHMRERMKARAAEARRSARVASVGVAAGGHNKEGNRG